MDLIETYPAPVFPFSEFGGAGIHCDISFAYAHSGHADRLAIEDDGSFYLTGPVVAVGDAMLCKV